MLGGMSQRDFKFFLKIVGKDIGDKIVANKLPVQQLCKLDSSFLKVMFNLDEDGLAQLRDSFDWILEKVFKSTGTAVLQVENFFPQTGSEPIIRSKQPLANGEEGDEKDIEKLVKGCGAIIPNDLPEGIKKCYTWFFQDGNWQNWKTESTTLWRYGCNWGGEGTICGFVFPDGANYCQNCGTKLERLHRKFYYS